MKTRFPITLALVLALLLTAFPAVAAPAASPAGAHGPSWLASVVDGGGSFLHSIFNHLRPERFGQKQDDGGTEPVEALDPILDDGEQLRPERFGLKAKPRG